MSGRHSPRKVCALWQQWVGIEPKRRSRRASDRTVYRLSYPRVLLAIKAEVAFPSSFVRYLDENIQTVSKSATLEPLGPRAKAQDATRGRERGCLVQSKQNAAQGIGHAWQTDLYGAR